MTDEERREARDMWLGDAPLPEWMARTEQEKANMDAQRKRMGLDELERKQAGAEPAERRKTA